ncbi:MarR family winged helix-turn-helix transcriptional regulator [Streptomyces sp. MAR4 CNX-425]|uniref:MarR family winged helix-turn-helix transcriptional regulator n=1 Tax=Streptomyces sp. MAR4 CNX-425 TaxID=3406343 RepID=UPI003B502D71
MARYRTAGQEQAQRPRSDFRVAERPGYLLHKAAMLLDEDVEKHLVAGVAMRSRYFLLLATMASGPELSQKDLSQLLNLDPTTVVTVIDEMERNQHVERKRNPADRRRYQLHVTPAGRKALAAAEKVATEVESSFFGTLTDSERETLRDMLSRVMAGRWPASVCERSL